MTINFEINNLILELLPKVQSILTDAFIGMSIGGSIANNSFDPITSDIDFYVITSNGLSKDTLRKLEEMHKQFYSIPTSYAKKMEISYIPLSDLLNFDPCKTRPYFNEGKFYMGEYGNNFLIELFMLREKGITITGPNIKELIKEITTQDLKSAVKKNLKEYWEPSLKDLSKYQRSDYQVFAILTMCRTLYTLEVGDIASKSEAAQWAINKLDPSWTQLIEEAMTLKPDSELNKQEETCEFVKYVIVISDKD